MTSPFLALPPSTWIASNALAFAVRDAHSVSPGHTLGVTRRLVPDWFSATMEEQRAILELDITQASALEILLDWQSSSSAEAVDGADEADGADGDDGGDADLRGRFEARVVEVATLPLDDDCVSRRFHFSPACSRMLFSVAGGRWKAGYRGLP